MVLDKLADNNILGGVRASRLYGSGSGVDDLIIVACTEVNTEADRAAYATELAAVLR